MQKVWTNSIFFVTLIFFKLVFFLSLRVIYQCGELINIIYESTLTQYEVNGTDTKNKLRLGSNLLSSIQHRPNADI